MASRLLLYGCAGALLVGSSLLIAQGLATGLVALVLVAVAVVVVVAGPERAGFGFLWLAFLTAPFYKGLAERTQTVSLTQIFVFGAVVLLLPRILTGRTRFAPAYVVGVVGFFIAGAVASVASAQPAASLVVLFQIMVCIAVIPALVASLGLAPATVNRFAWAFVAGQLLSTAAGIIEGPYGDGGRYAGLTQHPNAFAQSGMLAFALLLHLVTTTRRRWLVVASMAVCLASVYISASRAATLVTLCLIVLIPLVERSAVVGYLLAFAGFGAGMVLLYLFDVGQTGGSFARLAGGGSAAGSDAARRRSLAEGISRFGDHPLLGNGFLDLFDIHNNYVEIAVAAGVFGLVAWVVVLVSLARGLFGRSPLRRLCYPVIVYAAFGATIPSLTDTTIWMAVVLSIAVFRGFMDPPETVLPNLRGPATSEDVTRTRRVGAP